MVFNTYEKSVCKKCMFNVPKSAVFKVFKKMIKFVGYKLQMLRALKLVDNLEKYDFAFCGSNTHK